MRRPGIPEGADGADGLALGAGALGAGAGALGREIAAGAGVDGAGIVIVLIGQ